MAVAIVVDVTTLKGCERYFAQVNGILNGLLLGFRLRCGLLGLPGIRRADIADAADS
jgi:hypothetical protein